jgi:two-component system, LuxR family, response regulator FixJ
MSLIGAPPASAATEGMPVAQAMIAVVDDEALVRAAIASLLRSLGYQATAFESAGDFLAGSDTGFDCLVSDVQMPDMSGLDLHRRLRARGSALPVVLMTAHATPAVDSYAAASDVAALLEKPIDPDALIAAVQKAIATA